MSQDVTDTTPTDGVKRREFLKVLGATGAAATMVGCSSDKVEKLIPYVVSPDNTVPGVSTYYATTCRECAAGCGLLVETRDGRAIKAEGNPEHPVNHGALCARGQAGLQGLYNPDRFRSPMMRQGDKLVPTTWDKALETLGITESPFDLVNGNVQGYAQLDSIAVNPVAEFPHKTRFHEIAHVVLGHTKEGLVTDSERTPRDIREVEAEGVAYILCNLLGLPGLHESRGYIQNWIGSTATLDDKARSLGIEPQELASYVTPMEYRHYLAAQRYDALGLTQREFIALNAELARGWKPIIERKQAPADADEWAKVKAKRALLER